MEDLLSTYSPYSSEMSDISGLEMSTLDPENTTELNIIQKIEKNMTTDMVRIIQK